MTDTIGTGKVTLIRENEDGSANYHCNFSPEELDALTRLGILTAIQAGIEDAKKLSPDYPSNPEFTDEIKDLAKEAGFCMWGDESWRPLGTVVDWANQYDDDLVKFYHLVREQALKEVES